ncbi:hypothetical protein D9M68_338790 [compost metagenome]
MRKASVLSFGALALGLLAGQVMAAVSTDEAAKLGTTLTPLGAQKEGNADGSIPAWTGGLKADAAPVSNGFLGNPFEGEQPLFTITAQNVEQYKDKLTPGQQAMFKRYAATYKIPVYKTQRTASAPQEIYEAAKKSATIVSTINDGNGLSKEFSQARYYPFPIPQNGVEVVWNHMTRYRGKNQSRLTAQAAPQTNGSYTIVESEDLIAYPEFVEGMDAARAGNVLFLYKQRVTAPARLAGNVLLVHETIDQLTEPRMAWMYNAGQRRVRRAPQVAYDGPGTAADGMRTADNADMYNGSPDRYDWKLVGKRELYIPYNSYKLGSSKVKYADIIRPGHINQDLARYELHRVWEVVGTLKSAERHIYAKRHMFFDEDTWQASEIDHYDGRGQLWRVGEGHGINEYQQGIAQYAAIGLYDLTAGRYLVWGMNNEAKKGIEYGFRGKFSDFTPAALRNAGIR